jgi:hypothetical protein
MGERLFGGAAPDDSLRTYLKPPVFVSLKRLEYSSLFIQKFNDAFIVPHTFPRACVWMFPGRAYTTEYPFMNRPIKPYWRNTGNARRYSTI